MRRPCDCTGPCPDIHIPDLVNGLLEIFPETIDFDAYESICMTDGTNWESFVKFIQLFMLLASVAPSMRIKPKQLTAAFVEYFVQKPKRNSSVLGGKIVAQT